VDSDQFGDDHGRQVYQGVHHGGVPCSAGGQTVVSQGVGEALLETVAYILEPAWA
jgi:hypothetical protein